MRAICLLFASVSLVHAEGITSKSNTDQSAAVIDEIIVSAQRRAERLQDVPISITVLSGVEVDKDPARGLGEMLSRVPGVALDTSQYGGGSLSLTVRGVAAGNAVLTGSSPVGYYLDSVPFGFVKSAFVPDVNVYDVERVEALRGPQGTLYGAGSQNGVVRIITHSANLNEFELKSRLAASSTDGGGENYRADAAVNFPIIEGKLAARAVVGYQELSGWIDKPNEKNANDGSTKNMRVKLNATPAENLSLSLSAWVSRMDFDARNFSGDGETYPSVVEEPRSSDFETYNLTVGYQLPGVALTSMTSYIDYSDDMYNDLAPDGLANTIYHLYFPARTLSQEFSLTSTNAGPWRWAAGAIYRDSEDRIYGFRRQFVVPIDQEFQSQSYAVFGEVTRAFFDGKFEVTGGLRYFEDKVTEEEKSRPDGRAPLGEYSNETFDATTPRVVLSWHPGQSMTGYVSYAEGFRSGSAQNPLVLAVAPLPPVQPDTLKNYEAGIKGSLGEGSVSYEFAAYFIDWQDVQQQLVVPSAGFNLLAVVNGESASGPGADIGFQARLTDQLEVGLSGNWSDLTFDSDVLSNGVVLFNSGARLNNSPEWTVGGSADYRFPLGGNDLKGRLSIGANFTSARDVTVLAGTQRAVHRGDSLLVGRAGFSIDADRWSLSLFGENINNEQGAVAQVGGAYGITRIRPEPLVCSLSSVVSDG